VDAQRERTILAGRGAPAEGFLRHRGLIALAVGGAAAQASLLSVIAPAARPLAPQVTAVPPLAVFHDLRWLFGYPMPWYGFALTFAVLVLARAAVSAALIRLAWPRRYPTPAWGATFGRCVIFTVTASVLLSPVVTLLFGISLLPFSWPYLAALPAMLLIMVPLAHGGLLGSWWRTLPPARALGWLLASFVVLSAAAAALAILPAVGAVAAAGLAGLVNGRAWYGLAAALTRQEAPRPVPAGPARRWVPGRSWARGWPAPVSPLAATTALALIIGMTRLVFVLAGHTPQVGPPTAAPGAEALTAGPGAVGGPSARAGPVTSAVLVIGGFGSSCCAPSPALRRIGPPSLVQPFSYRGLDASGRPLPYGHDDTDLPLQVLGDRIAAQAWRLHRETGRAVSVVAESEGTLGVYAMLARHPDVPVRSVVLLSPIVDPGDAGYAASAGTGGDPVPGDALNALVEVAGALSPYGESGAQRLIGSVGSDGAAFAAEAARHWQQLRWLAVIPLADAVTLPVCDLPGNVIVVPALHGGLFGDVNVERMIERFLSDRRVAGPQQMRDAAKMIAAAAAAWRMPALESAPSACTG
jgi:hypothetical protein